MSPAAATALREPDEFLDEVAPPPRSAADLISDARVPIGSLLACPLNPRTRFDQAALEALADSIAQLGILEPLFGRPLPRDDRADIEIDGVSHGWVEVVFGGRRLRAGEILVRRGVWTPATLVPVRIRALSDLEAFEIAMTENLQRADMDPIDEANGYAKLRELLPASSGDKAAAIATRLGTSERTVKRRLKLLRCSPEVQLALRAGEITLAQAEARAGDDQVPALARPTRPAAPPAIPDDETDYDYLEPPLPIIAGPSADNPPAPSWPFGILQPLHYGCILADPPWQFQTFSAAGEGKSPQRHYDCMPLQQIQALPVAELAADDCALILWATLPMLPQALATMAAWGFAYKTGGAWAKMSRTGEKVAFGTGFILRSAAELFLIGTRGNPRAALKDVRGMIATEVDLSTDGITIPAAVAAHSQKPPQIYTLAEDLFAGPRCELFARRARDGWDGWGNQLASRAGA